MAKREFRKITMYCKCREKNVQVLREFILIGASNAIGTIKEVDGSIKDCFATDCDVVECIFNKDWSSGIRVKSKQCLEIK